MRPVDEKEYRRKLALQKEVIKEVMREWLDDQFAKFGKWSMRAIVAVVFFVVIKSLFHAHIVDLAALFDATGSILEAAH